MSFKKRNKSLVNSRAMRTSSGKREVIIITQEVLTEICHPFLNYPKHYGKQYKNQIFRDLFYIKYHI